MKKQVIFSALLAIAANNANGFTVSKDTLKPVRKGYAVALEATQNSFGNDGLANVLTYADTDARVNAIGGWYNSDNGQFYFDATVVVDDLNEALELGRRNHQIAIFDITNCKEIRL
jgi:hypothetical protein